MRFAVALLVVAAVSACAAKEEATPDSAATAVAAAPTLADYAGTWQTTTILEGTPDTVQSTLVGSADGSTWTMNLEGRPNIPVTASIVGDSIIMQSSEYESILRKGVMVTVRTAAVMSGGMMTGRIVATYKTPTGEQVQTGSLTATKAP